MLLPINDAVTLSVQRKNAHLVTYTGESIIDHPRDPWRAAGGAAVRSATATESGEHKHESTRTDDDGTTTTKTTTRTTTRTTRRYSNVFESKDSEVFKKRGKSKDSEVFKNRGVKALGRCPSLPA